MLPFNSESDSFVKAIKIPHQNSCFFSQPLQVQLISCISCWEQVWPTKRNIKLSASEWVSHISHKNILMSVYMQCPFCNIHPWHWLCINLGIKLGPFRKGGLLVLCILDSLFVKHLTKIFSISLNGSLAEKEGPTTFACKSQECW